MHSSGIYCHTHLKLKVVLHGCALKFSASDKLVLFETSRTGIARTKHSMLSIDIVSFVPTVVFSLSKTENMQHMVKRV